MAAAALQEGEVFANRYRIVRELASGGMGAVYEVIHTVTERRCALKVMLSHTVEREQLRKRFMQESRLAAQIGSEYIVDVLDAGVDDVTKAPYLVMELLEGEDLGQRLVRQGPLSREETVAFLWHVALALDRTHQAGIVHRDLKASNLFLTRREDGTPLVKVLDFGVAKVLTLERAGGEQRTQTVGTPIYMAPEQFRAEGRISAATDIYALGMLAYTLLVGVHYWTQEHEKCENPFAFASIAVHGPKDNPSVRAAREHVVLPEEFDGWFFRATSRWPQDRFLSATTAVVELASVLGVEAPVMPLTSSQRHLDPPSGDRAQAGAGLAATIESPSARLSDTPGRASTASAPSLSIEQSSVPGEHHTEVSLSVTSGSLPFVIEDPKPARGKAFAIAAAVALASAAVAVGVGVALHSNSSSDVRATAPAPVPSGSAALKPVKAPAERVTKIEDLHPPPAERVVKSIDELPIAPPDTPAAAPRQAPDDSTHNTQPVPARPRPRVKAETPGLAAPIPASDPPPPPAKPKVPDRDSLYGRD
jgi:serine/threonine-protein kinase